MQSAADLLRILGSALYYSPEDPQIYTLFQELHSIPSLYPWQSLDDIQSYCADLSIPDQATLTYEFSILFEGQGAMPVPPWGSVYLDKFNLLMSDSTLAYRQFLSDQRLVFTSKVNEPEDQIGLMLLALSVFVAQAQDDAIKILLSEHLSPWAFRYLALLAENDTSTVYGLIGKITTVFLEELMTIYTVTPAEATLYY